MENYYDIFKPILERTIEDIKRTSSNNHFDAELIKFDPIILRVIIFMVHDILEKGIDVFTLEEAVYEALGVEKEIEELLF